VLILIEAVFFPLFDLLLFYRHLHLPKASKRFDSSP
jgi:hypothetical protein